MSCLERYPYFRGVLIEEFDSIGEETGTCTNMGVVMEKKTAGEMLDSRLTRSTGVGILIDGMMIQLL